MLKKIIGVMIIISLFVIPIAYAVENTDTLDLPEKKVIIQGKEITGKMINGQTYIPVAELMGLKYPISPIHVTIEEDRIIFEEKYPFITDFRDSVKILNEIRERCLERIQKRVDKNLSKKELGDEIFSRYLEAVNDVNLLETIFHQDIQISDTKNILNAMLGIEKLTHIVMFHYLNNKTKTSKENYRIIKECTPKMLGLLSSLCKSNLQELEEEINILNRDSNQETER
ncbi:hypothetical protein H0A61_00573 [Koleobacter methoxysyntrophicus]|uniref:Uncharacterized protein n=1 Tax=Koleobacter methoxysyntrophicus TaxID=2751313 RepID=A0A8A0RJ65_9FIRM|nr:hypothetical protein [Koleobacter methoxysyntrophicus]QSQ08253.1 hypothetical protein H0A61_00573 [Koleobacter methoxysyntrophicus]